MPLSRDFATFVPARPAPVNHGGARRIGPAMLPKRNIAGPNKRAVRQRR